MALIQYLSRISFDFGAISLLGEEIGRLGLKRPLLVTDKGVAAAGILERALDAARPFEPVVYDDTTENPTEASLLECLEIWNDKGCDGAIALGGGSPIDLTKAVALLTSHGGELAGEFGIARLLSRVEPQVLEDDHATVLQTTHLGLGVLPNRIGGKGHVLAQQLAEPLRRRSETELRIRAPLRPPQMAHQHDLAATIEHRLDRRQGHDDPAIVGDGLAVVERDIEIDTNQYGLAGDIDVGDGFLCHRIYLVLTGQLPVGVWSDPVRAAS